MTPQQGLQINSLVKAICKCLRYELRHATFISQSVDVILANFVEIRNFRTQIVYFEIAWDDPVRQATAFAMESHIF